MKRFELKQKVYHEQYGRGTVINTKKLGAMAQVDFKGFNKWFSHTDKALKHSLNSYEVSPDDVMRVANKYKDLAVKVQQLQERLKKEVADTLQKSKPSDVDLISNFERRKFIKELELILQGY